MRKLQNLLVIIVLCCPVIVVRAAIEDNYDYLAWAQSWGLRVTEDGSLPDVSKDYTSIPNFRSGTLPQIFNVKNETSPVVSFSVFKNGKISFLFFIMDLDSTGHGYKIVTFGDEFVHLSRTDPLAQELTQFVAAFIQNYNLPKAGVEFENGAFAQKVFVPSLVSPVGKKELVLMKVGTVYSDQAGRPTDPDFSFRLLEQVDREIGDNPKIKKVLVLGSGTGYEMIYLLKMFSSIRVDAVDIDPQAIVNTRMNLNLYNLNSRGRVSLQDLFGNGMEKYDLILFAVPRPVIKELAGSYPQNRSQIDPAVFDLDGVLLDRLLADIPHHLNPEGVLFVMTDGQYFPYVARPLGYKIELRYEAPWNPADRGGGNFAIFKVRPPAVGIARGGQSLFETAKPVCGPL